MQDDVVKERESKNPCKMPVQISGNDRKQIKTAFIKIIKSRINLGEFSPPLGPELFSEILSKGKTTIIIQTITSPGMLQGRETWSHTLKKRRKGRKKVDGKSVTISLFG